MTGVILINATSLCRFVLDVQDRSAQGAADAIALTLDCGEFAGPRYKTPQPVPLASGNITLHKN